MRRPSTVELMLLTTVLLWALNLSVTKCILTHGLEPLPYATVRYGLAALIFVALTLVAERTLHIERRHLPIVGLAAVALWLNQLSFVFALDLTTASTIGLLLGAIPIFTELFGLLLGTERPSRRFWIAAAISGVGVGLVALGAGGQVYEMAAEGVTFRPSSNIGKDIDARELLKQFDALCLSGGSTQARDLEVPGRELRGVYRAMQYLPLQNRRVAGDKDVPELSAKGKHVVLIGGGDTGSDCVGTSNRHGAKSVTQFELLPMPADPERNPVWPYWPIRMRTSSSHEEGAQRDWAVATKEFIGEKGKVKSLKAVRLEWKDGRMSEIKGSEFTIPADLVLLAMGFVNPVQSLLEEFGVERDARGNAKATTDGEGCYHTSGKAPRRSAGRTSR